MRPRAPASRPSHREGRIVRLHLMAGSKEDAGVLGSKPGDAGVLPKAPSCLHEAAKDPNLPVSIPTHLLKMADEHLEACARAWKEN